MDCLSEEQAVRVLVDLANLRGGSDNITVLIIHARDGSTKAGLTSKTPESKQPPLVSPLLLGGTILCFLIAAVLGGLALGGRPQTVGAMIVMLISGRDCRRLLPPSNISSNRKRMEHRPVVGGGNGPYRSYDAKPTSELYDRLGATVQALRDAARERSWKMNWEEVDSFPTKGK